MRVNLLHYTPLSVPDMAIGKCWDKQKCEPDLDRMYRVANKHKHKSTIEHLVYSFDIDDISRACLQELARHRIASYSVKSTRYTLKELKDVEITMDNVFDFIVETGYRDIDVSNFFTLLRVQQLLRDGHSNDVVKFALPEAYKTSLVMTINARALQNFLELRTSRSALWEIRDLANNIYGTLPTEHRFLFQEFING